MLFRLPLHRPVQTAIGVAIIIGLAARCSSSPAAPTPPPAPAPAAPALTCPADSTIDGVAGTEATVTFPAPTIAGGASPVSVSCTPSSGGAFPLGPTNVVCTARDSLNRQAFCTFTVTVSPSPLAADTFVAFGDSVTSGENGITAFRPFFVDAVNAYPTQLQSMLRGRYPSQTQIGVINEGRGGERATESVSRLPSVLSRHRPQVLLMLTGFNDLLGDGTHAAQPVVDALRTNVRAAFSAGVRHVFVSTLPPSAPGKRQINPDAIVQTNAMIRQFVASDGAVVVDPYPAFLGHEQELLESDGLHLRPEGNRVVAQKFFDAILVTVR
jgi:lysophospholipase L1-like esterase